MPKRKRQCSTPGCGRLTTGRGRCDRCQAKALRFGTNRHYGTEHETRFRAEVLERDPVCVLCESQPSEHADHHPYIRRELLAMHEDPNDPYWGRGLCARCHARVTALDPRTKGVHFGEY